jgi:hypothetical protein
MTPYEEELQRKIEHGETLPDDQDVNAYQQVFKNLSKAPDYILQASFADRVMQKVLAKKQAQESSKDLWWFGAGIFLLVITLIVAFAVSFAYIRFKFDFGFLNAVADYKGLFLVAVLLVLIFNRFEKKLFDTKRIA